MRKYCLLFVLSFVLTSFGQTKYVMCEVSEYKKVVTIDFGEDIKYIGTDYVNQIGLYDKDKNLKYKTALQVCSYLCAHWGWKPYGNPTRKHGRVTYTLRHVVDFNTNLQLEMELFEEYERTHKE